MWQGLARITKHPTYNCECSSLLLFTQPIITANKPPEMASHVAQKKNDSTALTC